MRGSPLCASTSVNLTTHGSHTSSNESPSGSSTCNDHAESTVPNRFVPWIRDVLVSEVGTPAHYHQVHCLVFKLSGPPGSRGRRAARHAEWSATADLIMREVFSPELRSSPRCCRGHCNRTCCRTAPRPSRCAATTAKRSSSTLSGSLAHVAHRMHEALREHQASDVLMAELRVCGILQVLVYRVIQTRRTGP